MSMIHDDLFANIKAPSTSNHQDDDEDEKLWRELQNETRRQQADSAPGTSTDSQSQSQPSTVEAMSQQFALFAPVGTSPSTHQQNLHVSPPSPTQLSATSTTSVATTASLVQATPLLQQSSVHKAQLPPSTAAPAAQHVPTPPVQRSPTPPRQGATPVQTVTIGVPPYAQQGQALPDNLYQAPQPQQLQHTNQVLPQQVQPQGSQGQVPPGYVQAYVALQQPDGRLAYQPVLVPASQTSQQVQHQQVQQQQVQQHQVQQHQVQQHQVQQQPPQQQYVIQQSYSPAGQHQQFTYQQQQPVQQQHQQQVYVQQQPTVSYQASPPQHAHQPQPQAQQQQVYLVQQGNQQYYFSAPAQQQQQQQPMPQQQVAMHTYQQGPQPQRVIVHQQQPQQQYIQQPQPQQYVQQAPQFAYRYAAAPQGMQPMPPGSYRPM